MLEEFKLIKKSQALDLTLLHCSTPNLIVVWFAHTSICRIGGCILILLKLWELFSDLCRLETSGASTFDVYPKLITIPWFHTPLNEFSLIIFFKPFAAPDRRHFVLSYWALTRATIFAPNLIIILWARISILFVLADFSAMVLIVVSVLFAWDY